MTLALVVAAWLAGLLLGLKVQVEPVPLLLLAVATLPLGWLLRLTGRSIWPAALAGASLLALLRVEAPRGLATPLVTDDGQRVTLRGRIVNDPEAGARSITFVLVVEAIDRGEGWQSFLGRMHNKEIGRASCRERV